MGDGDGAGALSRRPGAGVGRSRPEIARKYRVDYVIDAFHFESAVWRSESRTEGTVEPIVLTLKGAYMREIHLSTSGMYVPVPREQQR